MPFSQSNFPESTITPPIDVPCPPINFVDEYTTMSTPKSIGRKIYGEDVLSRMSGIPLSWAIFERTSRSAISSFGFPIDSAYTALVFLLIAFLNPSKSEESTKLTFIPRRGNV